MNPAILNSIVVIGATLAVLLMVFHPRTVNSVTWRATVTPLASIIGSGFLVLGPILKHSFGTWGVIVMCLLCVVAYLFGDAIRYNIARYDEAESEDAISHWVKRLEAWASYALAIAYIVSITYYLNLFGAFAVSMTSMNDATHARIVTSAALAFVACFGWLRGFSALERIEEGTVGLKLAIIAGLLVGLLAFFVEKLSGSGLYFAPRVAFNWQSIAIALGLVITVQGFETSRYLGNEFDAPLRIRTMKLSQWISTAIYIAYIALTTFCFTNAQVPSSETGIIQMTGLVAPILPLMLVVAALAAQLSASVADTGGCGGLVEEVTHKRVKAKTAYLLIGVVGISLTWVTNIYSIISYASRAFAVYYAFQCAIAIAFAKKQRNFTRVFIYGLLTLVALAVVIFGRSAES